VVSRKPALSEAEGDLLLLFDLAFSTTTKKASSLAGKKPFLRLRNMTFQCHPPDKPHGACKALILIPIVFPLVAVNYLRIGSALCP
jgi:hypothetical protein